jgi:hypothetical protein
LSLTGSGEPTCSPDAVSEALSGHSECAKQGAYFPNVNLFTNGINIGNKEFADKWLPFWKMKGLTSIAVSVHYPTEEGQASAYGIKEYPLFQDIISNIKRHRLQCRLTLLLRKGAIDHADFFKWTLDKFIGMGCQNFTSWMIANPDGSRNGFSPSRWNMFKIRWWLRHNCRLCHGHVWGGGVYDYNGSLVRLTDYVTKHNPNKDFVRQLVVFQDGMVAYSWIKEGAICFMP